MNAFGIKLPGIKGNKDQSIFGEVLGWNRDFLSFDLSLPGHAAGALLAASALFTHQKDMKKMKEFLSVAISSIENTGDFSGSQELTRFLISNSENIDTGLVMQNIQSFYKKAGIAISPDNFTTYIRGLDKRSPTVSANVVDDQQNVDIADTLVLKFSEPVRKFDDKNILDKDVPNLIYLLKNGVKKDTIKIQGKYIGLENKMKIWPVGGLLSFSKNYSLGVRPQRIEDYNNNSLVPFSVSFDTQSIQNVDYNSYPLSNSVGIDVRDSVLLTFKSAVRLRSGKSLNSANLVDYIKVTNLKTGAQVPGTVKVHSNKKLAFLFNALLPFETKFRVNTAAAILEGKGTGDLVLSREFAFTTEKLIRPTFTIHTIDRDGKSTQTINDGLNDMAVANIRKIRIVFNEPIYSTLASIDKVLTDTDLKKMIRFKKGGSSGPSVAFTASIDLDRQKVDVLFSDKLLYNTNYLLQIENIRGIKNNVSERSDIHFKTKSWRSTAINAAVKSVFVTKDNDILVGGEYIDKLTIENDVFNSHSHSQDIFCALFNSDGELKWTINYGNSGVEKLHSVAMDLSGKVYILGSFVGSIVAGGKTFTSKGMEDAFLLRYGSIISSKVHNLEFGNRHWRKRDR